MKKRRLWSKFDPDYLPVNKRILFALRCKRRPRTAGELSKMTNTYVDALAGELCRMVNKGQLVRIPGVGPKFGNGYIKRKKPKK